LSACTCAMASSCVSTVRRALMTATRLHPGRRRTFRYTARTVTVRCSHSALRPNACSTYTDPYASSLRPAPPTTAGGGGQATTKAWVKRQCFASGPRTCYKPVSDWTAGFGVRWSCICTSQRMHREPASPRFRPGGLGEPRPRARGAERSRYNQTQYWRATKWVKHEDEYRTPPGLDGNKARQRAAPEELHGLGR